MKTDNYLRDTMALLLSFGHAYKYRGSVVEKRIALSPFFQAVEKAKDEYILCENIGQLISSTFYDANVSNFKYIIFNECAWLAELYIQIQKQTKMTFEGIFLYLPIDEGYSLFPVYHEMDFSQSIQYFLEQTKKHSLLYLAMKRNGVGINELSHFCGLSYSMISALRTGKKDIGKVAAVNLLKVATYLGIRIETLISSNN